MTQEPFDPEEVARFEKSTWSRCADTYMAGFGALVGEAIGPLLDEVKITENDRVLDVGTGPGHVAAAAAERGADVVGVDFAEAMVAKARRLHPDIEFQTASAESLSFDDASFDAVVGNFVLHHLGRPDQALREACRILRTGGRIGFTVWADLTKLEAFGLFFAAMEEHAGSAQLPFGPLFGVSDFAVYHQLVRGAGFHDSAVSELPIAWRTSSIDAYLASFRDWANLGAFPKKVQDSIQASVRERAGAYLSGNVFVMPNPAILISGVK